MKRNRPLQFALLVCLLLLFAGCAKKEQKPAYTENPPSAAQNKLVEIARDDYGADITVKSFGNTAWVYVPLEEDIIDIKATGFGLSKEETSDDPLTVNYLAGEFKDGAFSIAYDIGPARKYAVSYGYGTTYPPKVQDLQRSILTAISRAYADVKQVPGENKFVFETPGDTGLPDEHTHDVPDFFIIVVADIVKGLEMRMTAAFADLRRVMTDPTFTEEYGRRAVYETPIGNKNIINDRTGTYIDYTPLSWPEFIAKQIVYRVQYKFQQSSNKPSEDVAHEILMAAGAAVAAYDFTGFESVILRNLGNKTEETHPRPKLKDYAPDEPGTKGRLHHIKFF